MRKNKVDDKPLSEIIENIENSLNIVLDSGDTNIHEQGKNLSKNLRELKQGLRGMRIVILVCLGITVISIAISIVLILNYDRVNKLNDQLVEKSVPTKHDSLKNKLLNEKDGSIKYNMDKNGNVITYQNLSDSQDSLIKNSYKYSDTISDLRLKLSLAKRAYGIDFYEEKKGDKTYVIVKSSEFDKIDSNYKELKKRINPTIDSITKNK